MPAEATVGLCDVYQPHRPLKKELCLVPASISISTCISLLKELFKVKGNLGLPWVAGSAPSPSQGAEPHGRLGDRCGSLGGPGHLPVKRRRSQGGALWRASKGWYKVVLGLA